MYDKFYGFETKRFKFEEKEAIVVFADESNRTNKWILKTEYFGAFPEVEVMLLKDGYNLAHVDNETRWCLESDTKRQADFCKYLHKCYEFHEKCALVGMSCGGMQSIYLAAEYPELVSVMYLDAPVINLLSCPGDLGAGCGGYFDEFQKAKGMDLSELIGYRNHPLDRIPELLKSNIPTILVSGNADTIVPFEENGRYLYQFAKEHELTLELYLKDGGDHHPHGLPDNSIVAEFIKKYY